MSGFYIWLYGAVLVALLIYVFAPKPSSVVKSVTIGAAWPFMLFFLFLTGFLMFIWWILTGNYCERSVKEKRK